MSVLRASGLPDAQVIEQHLTRSAEEYARDNNNSMTNSRQALEQLLVDIANETARARRDAAPAAERIRDYLEQCGFFTQEDSLTYPTQCVCPISEKATYSWGSGAFAPATPNPTLLSRFDQHMRSSSPVKGSHSPRKDARP